MVIIIIFHKTVVWWFVWEEKAGICGTDQINVTKYASITGIRKTFAGCERCIDHALVTVIRNQKSETPTGTGCMCRCSILFYADDGRSMGTSHPNHLIATVIHNKKDLGVGWFYIDSDLYNFRLSQNTSSDLILHWLCSDMFWRMGRRLTTTKFQFNSISYRHQMS